MVFETGLGGPPLPTGELATALRSFSLPRGTGRRRSGETGNWLAVGCQPLCAGRLWLLALSRGALAGGAVWGCQSPRRGEVTQVSSCLLLQHGGLRQTLGRAAVNPRPSGC